MASPQRTSNTTSATGSHLVQLTWDKITQLEQSIKQVAATKKQLHDNALEVKSRVRTAISRQMESLRSREVFLLDQVDLLQQTQDSLLRKHEDHLQRRLGGLQGALVYCQDDAQSAQTLMGAGVKRKLSESLENLDDCDVMLEESPELYFSGDMSSLKSAIHSFGEVDCTYKPFESEYVAVMKPDGLSSLPETFEDYDDAEHHVLYKTVQDVKTIRNNDNSICVKVPRLSMNEWLLPPVSLIASDLEPMVEDADPPSAGSTLMAGEWMRDKTPPFGVQQWLYDIQNVSISEEDQHQHGNTFELLTRDSQEDVNDICNMINQSWLINQNDSTNEDCNMNDWLSSSNSQSKDCQQIDVNDSLDNEEWLMVNDNDETSTSHSFTFDPNFKKDLMSHCWLKTSQSPSSPPTTPLSIDVTIFSEMFDISADRGMVWILQESQNPLKTGQPTCGMIQSQTTSVRSLCTPAAWLLQDSDGMVLSVTKDLSYMCVDPKNSGDMTNVKNTIPQSSLNDSSVSDYSPVKTAVPPPIESTCSSLWLMGTKL